MSSKDELEKILANLCDAGCRINGDKADGFGDYHTCEIPEALTSIINLVDKELADIETSLKQHTVPEGKHLITRSYAINTIDFARTKLRGES